MRPTMRDIEEIRLHEVEETFPPMSGDDCSKRNEEMIFQTDGAHNYHMYDCDCMKKNSAIRGYPTYTRPDAFGWSE